MKAVVLHVRDEDWLRFWPRDFPALDWAAHSKLAGAERDIADADILLLTNRAASSALGELLRGATALKWIHFLTAGFDRGVAMGLPAGVLVSHSPGATAPAVAEHALALLLGLCRRLPEMVEEQRAHNWRRDELGGAMRSLQGATVCVVGLGRVGREVARKLRAFDCRVIAVSRAGEAGGDIEKVFPRPRLREALSEADALVISTAADPSSLNLIGEAELAALKPGAYLINVARGSIVDEAALIAALRVGRLGGAALDVFAEEPLAPESPLWDLPNLIVSPHSAGAGANAYVQRKAMFAENLERFRGGRPLLDEYRPV